MGGTILLAIELIVTVIAYVVLIKELSKKIQQLCDILRKLDFIVDFYQAKMKRFQELKEELEKENKQ